MHNVNMAGNNRDCEIVVVGVVVVALALWEDLAPPSETFLKQT